MKMNTELESLIKKRFTARNFCTSFEDSSDSFDLQIDGMDQLKVPVQPRIAKKLIEIANPSKFGFKEKTLHDPSVRKSFEIEHQRIKLGKSFQAQITNSMTRIQNDLLLPSGSMLKAELHNMLIYEKGCFFDFHQDSEKEDGMVATLVVVLPSNYQGGELVLNYQGVEKNLGEQSYGFSTRSNTLKFMAFYADCQHKLQKVSYGYRVALTFNLILESPKEINASLQYSGLTRSINDYFATNLDQPSYRRNDPKWFVYLLNHQYTPKSLDWKRLKGVDKQTAADLKQAAEELDLDIFLTLAEIQETWSAYKKGDPYRSYGYEYDEDEDDGEDYDLEEIVNNETTLEGWLDKDGNQLNFANQLVRDTMIFMSQENDEYTPENSEYEGYMGNYGNTLDRWYKRSAIVLWPRKASIVSKFAIDPNLGIEEILKLLRSDVNTGRLAFDKLKETFSCHGALDALDSKNIVDLALLLNQTKTVGELFGYCSLDFLLTISSTQWIKLLAHYGDDVTSKFLDFEEAQDRYYQDGTRNYWKLLDVIYSNYPKTAKVFLNQWIYDLSKDLSPKSYMINDKDSLEKFSKKAQKSLSQFAKTVSKIKKPSLIEPLFDIALKLEASLGVIMLYEILSPSELQKILGPLTKFKRLKKQTRTKLMDMLKRPKSNSNWSIDEYPSCSCELCVELTSFLSSESQKEKIWPINKSKRQHVHQAIDGLKLPVYHETLREGRPYPLILKKKSSLFSWRKKKIAKCENLLESM